MIQATLSKLDFDFYEYGMDRIHRMEANAAHADYEEWLEVGVTAGGAAPAPRPGGHGLACERRAGPGRLRRPGPVVCWSRTAAAPGAAAASRRLTCADRSSS